MKEINIYNNIITFVNLANYNKTTKVCKSCNHYQN